MQQDPGTQSVGKTGNKMDRASKEVSHQPRRKVLCLAMYSPCPFALASSECSLLNLN